MACVSIVTRLVDDGSEYRPDEMAGCWLVLAPLGVLILSYICAVIFFARKIKNFPLRFLSCIFLLTRLCFNELF